LTPSFRDNAGESRQRSNIGQFVEREQQFGPVLVAVIGRVDNLFYETYNEGGGDCLMTTRRDDVKLVRPRKERRNIEWCLTCRRSSGIGAHPGKESRRS
jgi:hypothetical protein